MKNYNVWDATKRLRSHQGVIVSGAIIYQHRDHVGIRTLGVIDYLVNHNNYQRRLCNDKQWNQL